MFELTGKTALITGATGAIGGSIARTLHAQGATVAISGTRAKSLISSPPSSAAASMSCRAISPTAPRPMPWCRGAEEAMGQLDILVANAGVTKDNLFVQLRDEDWEQVIAINLSATFRLARAAVRGMMRRRFGRIIAITSVVGTTGNPGQANYVAAKAGITGMIKAIAQEYAKRGVTANCVAPGFIVTPMTDKLNDKQREGILAEDPGKPRRHRRGSRCRGRLSGLERGRLCDRTDVACERRNGHDLNAIGATRGRVPPRWSTHWKCGNRTATGLGCRQAGERGANVRL